MNDNDHLNNDYDNERLLQCWQGIRLSSSQPLLTVLDYQDLQDDSDNGNDDWMGICFQGQIQKKREKIDKIASTFGHIYFLGSSGAGRKEALN